jgi:hypothetical protein
MALGRAVLAGLSIPLVYVFVLYVISESDYRQEWKPLESVFGGLTRVQHPNDLDQVSDGWVYFTGNLTSSPQLIADPLFPEWTISATLLSRVVQVCKPREASPHIQLKRSVSAQWIDESNLQYPDGTDPLPIWYRSANFSHPAKILTLNLSDDLLDHGILELSVRRPPVRGVSPPELTAFPGGWFYASNTDNLTQRIRHPGVPEEGAGSVFTTLVLQTFGSPAPEERGHRIMRNCRKGDIRIKQLFLSPGTVSVIAWRSGSVLSRQVVGERTIGTIRKGMIEPENMFDLQLRERAAERTKCRFFLMVMTIVGIFVAVEDSRLRIAMFVVVGMATGIAKAVIWNSGLFRKDVWFSLLCMECMTMSGLVGYGGFTRVLD